MFKFTFCKLRVTLKYSGETNLLKPERFILIIQKDRSARAILKDPKRFMLGRAEQFVLRYLYKKFGKIHFYATHRELLNAYNAINRIEITDLRKTLKQLVSKDLIIKIFIPKTYYYWINYRGISIAARLRKGTKRIMLEL